MSAGLKVRHMRCIHARAAEPTSGNHLNLRPHSCRFKVEATYHSTHPSKGGLTITTYINMERLYFLESHCASWEGPLIVAAYLPLIAGRKADLGGALKRLHEEFSRCSAAGLMRHTMFSGLSVGIGASGCLLRGVT